MLAAALYLVLAYGVASLWESVFHRHVLHASRPMRWRWRRLGWPGQLLRLAHFFHHGIHHRHTFRRSLVVQFDAPRQQQRLDTRLRGAIGRRARADRYGLTVTGPRELLAFTGLPLLVNTGLAVAVSPWLLPAGVALAVAPFLLSRYVHPWLHRPPGGAGRLRRSAAFRFLQRYHLTHHRLEGWNYNLLPGADFLLGRWHRRVRDAHRSLTRASVNRRCR